MSFTQRAAFLVLSTLLVGCGESAEETRPAPDDPTVRAADDESGPRDPSRVRDDRSRVDTRARLDLTEVPDGVSVEMDGDPVVGVLILDPGEHRLDVHGDGVHLRTITAELHVGETTTPDLSWVPEALRAERRHEVARGAGTCKCEKSIEHGIAWLVAHRAPDGAWRADTFLDKCAPGTSCGGAVGDVSEIETTGLALLALLGIGETHSLGEYRSGVRDAADFLIGRLDDDGQLVSSVGELRTRAHAIGTLALTELVVMTGSRRYREPAQRAFDALVERRRPGYGWTEDPRARRPDAATTCWAAFAVFSAQAAEDEGFLQVPDGLASELAEDLALFGDPGGGAFPLHLGAMLTLAHIENIGIGIDDGETFEDGLPKPIASGIERILAHPPNATVPSDPRFLWFGAAALQRAGGKDAWKRWTRELDDVLVGPLTRDLDLLAHAPPAETSPEALLLGRLRATTYRQLAYEIHMRYGRVFGAASR